MFMCGKEDGSVSFFVFQDFKMSPTFEIFSLLPPLGDFITQPLSLHIVVCFSTSLIFACTFVLPVTVRFHLHSFNKFH